MNIAYKIKKWDISHPFGFTIIRVILGVLLLIRGICFLNNIQPLYALIKNSSLNTLNIDEQLTMIITWIHILGGTLITLGLFTKIAVWAQIPIVLGAIIFINIRHTLYATPADLFLSIFILLLLTMFAFEGGGHASMDNYVKSNLL